MTADDMAKIEATRRYFSYARAAEYLDIPTGTLRALVSTRKIPHIRIGPRKVTFDREELDRWIASRKVA